MTISSTTQEDEPSYAERAWAVEIERRARRALRGESKGRDWSSVRADLDARFGPMQPTNR
jgi:hypothetical protein